MSISNRKNKAHNPNHGLEEAKAKAKGKGSRYTRDKSIHTIGREVQIDTRKYHK